MSHASMAWSPQLHYLNMVFANSMLLSATLSCDPKLIDWASLGILRDQ